MASERFLRDGFAATGLEGIAAEAGCSKRTLYARFPSKEALFLDVVRGLIGTWRVGFDAALDGAGSLEAALLVAAHRMLDVALQPAALALHRLVVAESARVPLIAATLVESGAGSGIEGLCRVIARHRPGLPPARLAFVAEQFQHLVLSGPRNRASGLGERLDRPSLDAWCRDSVAMALGGL